RQVAERAPADVAALLAQPFVGDPRRTVNDRIADTIGLIRENMKPARFARFSGGRGGRYIPHHRTLGRLLEIQGGRAAPQLLREVCMPIAANNPTAALREDVSKEVIDKEREIAKAQMDADPKNARKPANILDQILEGKIKTWFAEHVLVEQPFVKDTSK